MPFLFLPLNFRGTDGGAVVIMHQAMGSKKQRLIPLTLYALLRSPYFSCLFWFFIFGGLYLIERNPKLFQDVLPKIPPSERSKVTVAVGVLLTAEELETMARLALQTWVASARAKGIIVKFFGAFDNEVPSRSLCGVSLLMFVVCSKFFVYSTKTKTE